MNVKSSTSTVCIWVTDEKHLQLVGKTYQSVTSVIAVWTFKSSVKDLMGAIRTWGPVLERTSHHSCKLDKRRKGEEIAEVRMLVATLFIKQQQQQQLAASRGKQRMHAMPESLFPGHHHHKHLFFTCEYVCMCALLYCHGYDYHSFVHMHTYSHTVLYIISGTIVFVPVVSPILPLIKCPL